MQSAMKKYAGIILLLLLAVQAFAKDRRIVKGKVVSESGESLIGVTVQEKNRTGSAVITNIDGNYTISITQGETSMLVFSCIGFETQEVLVGPRTEVDITLYPKSTYMDEVVVTGYQNINRRELASAVSQLDMDEIQLADKFSIDQMLAGQVAGMSVLTTSGDPSATPKIRIRGTSSLYGNTAPLWVLDGIILDDNSVNWDASGNLDPLADDAQYLVGNAIAGVNPSDIESITVLKDASATAIYGIQAANGVIVVTTKKGHRGAPRITYNGSVSVNQRENYRRLYLMDAGERVQLSKDLLAGRLAYTRNQFNLGYEMLKMQYDSKMLSRAEFNDAVDEMITRNTDWFDLLFRNSVSQNHTLGLSGGTSTTTYYASLGVSNTPGTGNESLARRYTAMLKLSSWVHPRVYFGFSLNGNISHNEGYYPTFNPDSYARETARTIPAYNDDGSLFFYKPYEVFSFSNMSGGTYRFNALHEAEATGNESDIGAITGLFNFVWKIYDGLRYELTGSYVYNAVKTNAWAKDDSYCVNEIRGWIKDDLEFGTPAWDNSVLAQGGLISKSETTKTTLDLRNTLSYSKDFNGHLVSALGTSELRSVITDGFSGTYYGWMPERGQIISPAYTDYYLNDIKLGRHTPGIVDNHANTVSWIFSGIYSYKDTYTINANVRMDGSNQFGENPEYRFLPIWSVAGKYALTNEHFMGACKDWLSYLAVRASYGIQGNVDKGTSPDLVMAIGNISSQTGIASSTVAYWPNPDLHWEKTTQYNVGLDFSFLGDRITGTVDVYKKVGTDMIMNKTISAVNGYTIRKINGGNVNNSGFELALKFTPVQNKKMRLVIGFIHSYNKNKLMKANDEVSNTLDNMISGSALLVGESLGTIYSYPFAGLDHDTGLPLFYDAVGNTEATWGSKTYKNYTLYDDEIALEKSGVLTPPHTGGINLEYRIRNWTLRGSFTYSLGAVGRLPFLYGDYDSVFDPEKNLSRELNDRWEKPGDEAHTDIPALYDDHTYENLGVRPMRDNVNRKSGTTMYDYSTARVCSTDNFRLRSLSLSYIFDTKMLQKMHLSNFQISAQANNLFIIADKRWHGFDPEQGPMANSSIPRTYSLSVTIGF